MKEPPIFVTQPYLPPLDDFLPYLNEIWDSKVLTNGGKMHQMLEDELCSYLGVENISLFSNGTLALIVALRALGVTGSVITTPYSFVATSHALLWNGNKPIFVDIDRNTMNIDASKIEAAITPDTTAILPVHCYGRPCNISAIEKVAEKFDLKIIYDSAHAFGVDDSGGSILRHGDLSVLSFHATKVFNTFEGGAIVSNSKELKKEIDQLKNFGFIDEVTVSTVGINGKMSEINAAFGLLQLKHIDEILRERERVYDLYVAALHGVDGISVIENTGGVKPNYSYFPIRVEKSYPLTRDDLYLKLRKNNIYARRYFFPLISDFPMYKEFRSAAESNLQTAMQESAKVLCLPIYPSLSGEEVEKVISLIR